MQQRVCRTKVRDVSELLKQRLVDIWHGLGQWCNWSVAQTYTLTCMYSCPAEENFSFIHSFIHSFICSEWQVQI